MRDVKITNVTFEKSLFYCGKTLKKPIEKTHSCHEGNKDLKCDLCEKNFKKV